MSLGLLLKLDSAETETISSETTSQPPDDVSNHVISSICDLHVTHSMVMEGVLERRRMRKMKEMKEMKEMIEGVWWMCG